MRLSIYTQKQLSKCIWRLGYLAYETNHKDYYVLSFDEHYSGREYVQPAIQRGARKARPSLFRFQRDQKFE